MWANRSAWLFFFLVSLCHIFTVSLFVNFDSHWYIRLSDILGTNLYPSDWDFLRTPIFPALLKLSFWCLGRDALAVFLLQTCLAAAGVWLLSRRLLSLGLRLEAALGVVVLGAFPNLIAYEHALLTEVGSFFCLALLIFLLAKPERASLKGAALLALAIAAGYYYRSSLIYLAPVAGVVYVVNDLREGWRRSSPSSRYALVGRAVPPSLVVAVLPFLLAYPWQQNPMVKARNGHVLLYGLVKQGVLPLHDAILGQTAPVYAKALEVSKANGVLPNQGITAGREWSVIGPIYKYGPIADSVFRRSIMADTPHYVQAVERNLILLSGFGTSTYDNRLNRDIIFNSSGSYFEPGPSWFPPLGDSFERATSPGFTTLALKTIGPVYDWLLPIGLLATITGFFLGILRADRAILAFTAPALAFLAMHALLLVSQDRLILPIQPILLLNLIALPAFLRAKKPLTIVYYQETGFRENGKRISQRIDVTGMRKGNLLGVGILIGLVVGLLLGYFISSLRQGNDSRSTPVIANTIGDLGVTAPQDITNPLVGYISTVNGTVPPEPRDAEHAVAIPAASEAVLDGWFVYGNPATSGVVMDEIFGLVDGTLVKASPITRPDVRDYFKNPKVLDSGYRLHLGPAVLGSGLKRVDMIGRTKQDGKLYRFAQPIFLVVR